MRRELLMGLSVLSALAVTACASGPPVQQRGWVGGETTRVSRNVGWFEHSGPPMLRARHVAGLPADVPHDGGLLVRRAPPGTPLHAAGIVEGDLLLELDGHPVGGPEDFVDAVQDRAPGAPVDVLLWREGALRRAALQIGSESYERIRTIAFGLGISHQIDLWPFDDGINVLGLVRAEHVAERVDDMSTEGDYARTLRPDGAIVLDTQERTSVGVVPVMISTAVRVVGHELAAAPAN